VFHTVSNDNAQYIKEIHKRSGEKVSKLKGKLTYRIGAGWGPKTVRKLWRRDNSLVLQRMEPETLSSLSLCLVSIVTELSELGVG
jgi:hypothetical protein